MSLARKLAALKMGTPNTANLCALDLVSIIDAWLPTLSGHARSVVNLRFEKQLRPIRVAEELGISRERVRQIEKKVMVKIRLLTRNLESLAADCRTMDLHEFNSRVIAPEQSMHFYKLLARNALGSANARQVNRSIVKGLQVVINVVMQADTFILCKMTPSEVWETAVECAPACAELGRETVLQLVYDKLGIKTVGGVLIGRKPTINKIILALVRIANGPIHISLLARQLEMVLAEYEESAHHSLLRIRDKLSRMEKVHFIDQNTVSLELQNPAVARLWKDKAIDAISAAGKAYSLVSFRLENPSCPFDEFSLASMLRDDRKVRHIGRRLYATAQWEDEMDVRVATLIEEALQNHYGPMTRDELLRFIRRHRDLRCGQIDNYFARVPNLVRYTIDVVGLMPLSREVMLSILCSEACVTALLGSFKNSKPIYVGALWLLKDDTPEFTGEEEQLLLGAGREWQTVSVEIRAARLYYEMRITK